MYINRKLQLAFVAIPKTGTYAVHDYFGASRNHPEPILHHMSADLMAVMYPETINYFKFAFVRNPWDKVVSIYHDFTERRKTEYSVKVKSSKPLLSEFKDFEDFCLGLKDSLWQYDVFFKPQLAFLSIPCYGLIDYIGRFENLQDDFNELCRLRGLPIRHLQEKNVGEYEHGYRKYYSQEAKDAIAKLYQQDIEYFKYEF